jgi:L-asparaginase II
MVDALRVVVRRGGLVEAEHHVIGCAVDATGAVVASFGDVNHVTFLRSSTKPIQAEPLHAAMPKLPNDLLAIACASHEAKSEHLAAVDRLLALSGSNEADLLNGPDDENHGRRYHDCSGKHAGMILACQHNNWSVADYIDPDHPLQQAVLRSVSQKACVPINKIVMGTDGCGVPCHGMPISNIARVYTAIDPAIASAMRAHPFLVGGPTADDTSLMQLRSGWTAKRGAQGLLCVQTDDGIGIVLKGIDGYWRGIRPAMSELSYRLGLGRIDAWDSYELRNSRNTVIGDAAIAP